MFGNTARSTAEAVDVVDPVDPADLIPLSVLALDLDEPGGGWVAAFTAAGVPVVEDDIGRASVCRVDAARLITERREAAARAWEASERRIAALAADQARSERYAGIPADRIPDGVLPVTALLQAAKDAEPKRRSVLEDALAGRGVVYHPIGNGGIGEDPS